MNKENVGAILDALAARLSVPAAHLWAVLVRQAAIDFWTMVAVAVVLSIIAAVLVRLFFTEYRREKGFAEDGLEMLLGVSSLVSSVAAIVCAVAAVSQIGYLINPEYYALRQVLGAIK